MKLSSSISPGLSVNQYSMSSWLMLSSRTAPSMSSSTWLLKGSPSRMNRSVILSFFSSFGFSSPRLVTKHTVAPVDIHMCCIEGTNWGKEELAHEHTKVSTSVVLVCVLPDEGVSCFTTAAAPAQREANTQMHRCAKKYTVRTTKRWRLKKHIGLQNICLCLWRQHQMVRATEEAHGEIGLRGDFGGVSPYAAMLTCRISYVYSIFHKMPRDGA